MGCLLVILTLISTILCSIQGSTIDRANRDQWQETLNADTSGLARMEQDWGYVDVRQGAHMFWWMFYSTHQYGFTNRPLVMWLQGGPGASSCGYGNFGILGPFDTKLQPRNTSWVKEANILFVDNPVGAGFSYTDSEDLLTTNVEQIAEDLLTLYAEFLEIHPEFKSIPFYIFGQSYGGKMAAAFARRLHESISNGNVESDFRGFAMGNAWISPEDSTITWGPMLHYMSLVDSNGASDIEQWSDKCQAAIHEEDWELATQMWGSTQNTAYKMAHGVDFYNVLNNKGFHDYEPRKRRDVHELSSDWLFLPGDEDEIDLMNSVIKEYLGIPEHVFYNLIPWVVFEKHNGDFMKPVWHIVDELLESTQLEVIVYQGQLDLICDTRGAENWVSKLTWNGSENFAYGKRKALFAPDTMEKEMFVKTSGKFKFYWNLMSGHAVPKDSWSALRMLRRIFDNVDNDETM